MTSLCRYRGLIVCTQENQPPPSMPRLIASTCYSRFMYIKWGTITYPCSLPIPRWYYEISVHVQTGFYCEWHSVAFLYWLRFLDITKQSLAISVAFLPLFRNSPNNYLRKFVISIIDNRYLFTTRKWLMGIQWDSCRRSWRISHQMVPFLQQKTLW